MKIRSSFVPRDEAYVVTGGIDEYRLRICTRGARLQSNLINVEYPIKGTSLTFTKKCRSEDLIDLLGYTLACGDVLLKLQTKHSSKRSGVLSGIL